jgi:hypothetical protein
MRISKFALAITSAALVSFSSSAQAADGRSVAPPLHPAGEEYARPHMGILAGMADPIGPTVSSPTYGIDIGFQPYIPLATGFQISGFSPGQRYHRTQALVKGSYNFGGTIPIVKSSYIGGKTGIILDNQVAGLKARYAIGPMFGFDLPITRNWTLGSEVAYLGVVGPEQMDIWSLVGAAKYWF